MNKKFKLKTVCNYYKKKGNSTTLIKKLKMNLPNSEFMSKLEFYN